MQSLLSYCDYIAATCAEALDLDLLEEGLISSVSGPQLDLHPTEGYMLSTAKKLTVEDCYGKRYRILVEEVVDNL
jgi:hypothetical protein